MWFEPRHIDVATPPSIEPCIVLWGRRRRWLIGDRSACVPIEPHHVDVATHTSIEQIIILSQICRSKSKNPGVRPLRKRWVDVNDGYYPARLQRRRRRQ